MTPQISVGNGSGNDLLPDLSSTTFRDTHLGAISYMPSSNKLSPISLNIKDVLWHSSESNLEKMLMNVFCYMCSEITCLYLVLFNFGCAMAQTKILLDSKIPLPPDHHISESYPNIVLRVWLFVLWMSGKWRESIFYCNARNNRRKHSWSDYSFWDSRKLQNECVRTW